MAKKKKAAKKKPKLELVKKKGGKKKAPKSKKLTSAQQKVLDEVYALTCCLIELSKKDAQALGEAFEKIVVSSVIDPEIECPLPSEDSDWANGDAYVTEGCRIFLQEFNDYKPTPFFRMREAELHSEEGDEDEDVRREQWEQW